MIEIWKKWTWGTRRIYRDCQSVPPYKLLLFGLFIDCLLALRFVSFEIDVSDCNLVTLRFPVSEGAERIRMTRILVSFHVKVNYSLTCVLMDSSKSAAMVQLTHRSTIRF